MRNHEEPYILRVQLFCRFCCQAAALLNETIHRSWNHSWSQHWWTKRTKMVPKAHFNTTNELQTVLNMSKPFSTDAFLKSKNTRELNPKIISVAEILTNIWKGTFNNKKELHLSALTGGSLWTWLLIPAHSLSQKQTNQNTDILKLTVFHSFCFTSRRRLFFDLFKMFVLRPHWMNCVHESSVHGCLQDTLDPVSHHLRHQSQTQKDLVAHRKQRSDTETAETKSLNGFIDLRRCVKDSHLWLQ